MFKKAAEVAPTIVLLLPKYLDVAELQTLVTRSGVDKYSGVTIEFMSINNKLQKLMVTYSVESKITENEQSNFIM